MKCTTRAQAVARYGPIDFASKHWGGSAVWLQMLEIPHGLAPNWKVQDTNIPVTHIACNKDIHVPLLTALHSLSNIGKAGELHTFDGCFNIRMVRGSNDHFSAHSYGLALDIDAATNPMGPVLHTTRSHEFVKCFTDQGFDWGGGWHGRKDPMHFSWCWE